MPTPSDPRPPREPPSTYATNSDAALICWLQHERATLRRQAFSQIFTWRQKFLSQLICDEVVRHCGKPGSRVTNHSQFNRLQVTIFHREKSCLAPKSGVDISRHHVYLRFRR